jgi:pyrroline-5-carboxylate reductase
MHVWTLVSIIIVSAFVQVIRVMPNTPCMVREGAIVYCRGPTATAADGNMVKDLFCAVGECHEVDEALIDVVTGLSGSGPAYMYLIIGTLYRYQCHLNNIYFIA